MLTGCMPATKGAYNTWRLAATASNYNVKYAPTSLTQM